jgi:hypothetical protein
MDSAELARRMEREREFWVIVAPGKRIKFLRPLMDEARTFGLDFSIGVVCKFVRGWDGITEGDLLSNGGAEPVEFDVGLATSLLRDHLGWAKASAEALGNELTERAKLTSTAEKNFATS